MKRAAGLGFVPVKEEAKGVLVAAGPSRAGKRASGRPLMDQEPGFALVPCGGTERDEAFSAFTEEADVALWVLLLAGKTFWAATRLAAVHMGSGGGEKSWLRVGG